MELLVPGSYPEHIFVPSPLPYVTNFDKKLGWETDSGDCIEKEKLASYS
jgi:hypothetical protein